VRAGEGIATRIDASLLLVSWVARENAGIVHISDTGNGVTYSRTTPRDGAPRHEKGAITLLP